MNIKILDSWLREYLETDAKPEKIAECLSLTSVAIERMEPYGENDVTYDIEVTTNRVDLMSVVGLAREAAAVLPRFDISAVFKQPQFSTVRKTVESTPLLSIHVDPQLVNRICAVILEVEQHQSPQIVKDRLESSGIRSLSNIVDITNYVMRLIGHPTHIFDYDRLNTKKLIIRTSERGEKITTLDGKKYSLKGGDIVADDGTGRVVDLLGVMGLENSVVTDDTKRIVFFINNNDPTRIRKTSMSNAIRTDAAILNEKNIDPEAALDAIRAGIDLFKEYAHAKLLSDIIDIYPNKPVLPKTSVTKSKINQIIGVPIALDDAASMLNSLGITTKIEGETIHASIPSFRAADIMIPEDLVEEIARMYGYYRLPSTLPDHNEVEAIPLEDNPFYWIRRIKQAFKYWGFTESYTYSLVSEDMYEGDITEAVKLSNPLSSDMTYLRRTLVPSLLAVLHTNKGKDYIKLFEIANVYEKKKGNLPSEKSKLAFVIKSDTAHFLIAKGVLEQLFTELNISNYSFKKLDTRNGAEILLHNKTLGTLEILDEWTVDGEFDMELLLQYANNHKTFTPIPSYPAIIEDLRFEFDEPVEHERVVRVIKKQSSLIRSVELYDTYGTKRTYRIAYQDATRNLTNEDIAPIRMKIITAIQKNLHAHVA